MQHVLIFGYFELGSGAVLIGLGKLDGWLLNLEKRKCLSTFKYEYRWFEVKKIYNNFSTNASTKNIQNRGEVDIGGLRKNCRELHEVKLNHK